VPDDHDLSRGRIATVLRRLRDDQRGMTLVEAMVAAMLLLVGIVPTVKVFDDSRDQNATGERHEIALLQAEQALEEMRGLPYDRLLMNAGASDPGGGRVAAGGTTLQVRSDLSEPLVYYTTEGAPVGNAWVRPVSQVTTGSDDAPVDMTIYRFVSWRDEECSVADLSHLGLSLPTAITTVQTQMNSLSTVITSLLTRLTGSKTALQNLQTRLNALNASMTTYQTQLTNAVAGVSELDLCDLDSTTLAAVQKLGVLTPGLTTAGALNSRLATLQNALGQICLPLVGCVLGTAQNNAITSVNTQLDCLFGSNSGSAQFNTYLSGLATGLSRLGTDLADTQKNTKRITVAVVIEPRPGVGPFDPVWASSVVRDPAAGLLTSGAASCSS